MSVGPPAPISGWQRANVLAAVQYLREIMARTPGDEKAQAVYQGLLEVLEPARRTVRQQRELTDAMRSSVTMREKRAGADRRRADRRRVNLGSPTAGERRKTERRTGRDRRTRA